MRSADLAQKISNRVIREIAEGHYNAGDRLTTQSIADRYGVSRTPVRSALGLLADQGILGQVPNRGYFVSRTIPDGALTATNQDELTREYQSLAEDWIRDRIPEEMTELALRERYSWTKVRTQELLGRAQREGWAERKEGYGWRFLPVAKTPEAFDQIYRFRIANEPVAMLEPTFKIDFRKLAELREVQEKLVHADPATMPNETILQHGADFHESLVAMSGNPFFLIALERVNRMRRLMEYRARVDRGRLANECGEHLEILTLLEQERISEASARLRRHLEDARDRKAPNARAWAEG
ncbi:GntR family transcriptional regulator [Salipiger mangrovisoli]|uniref:GntR family transcriptional regulator n=1 Tax=Salipiger mangrovisoli TaxID=2865933 RepID=A0ABR9X870_9RHOB|nr:GntR family transcriptional regulator [Salipiger mangrovisoli]MBE9639626.1 GntR family transcriptional regulator [Salipiger mangrovisoli]